jgi:hypothetical protein
VPIALPTHSPTGLIWCSCVGCHSMRDACRGLHMLTMLALAVHLSLYSVRYTYAYVGGSALLGRLSTTGCGAGATSGWTCATVFACVALGAPAGLVMAHL